MSGVADKERKDKQRDPGQTNPETETVRQQESGTGIQGQRGKGGEREKERKSDRQKDEQKSRGNKFNQTDKKF